MPTPKPRRRDEPAILEFTDEALHQRMEQFEEQLTQLRFRLSAVEESVTRPSPQCGLQERQPNTRSLGSSSLAVAMQEPTQQGTGPDSANLRVPPPTWSATGTKSSVLKSVRPSAVARVSELQRAVIARDHCIHAYAIMEATEPHCKWNVLFAVLSLSIVILQAFVLSGITSETSSTSCFLHEQCKAGLFCNNRSAGTRGTCSDCSDAQNNVTMLAKWPHARSALSFCKRTDMFHDQCDYVVTNTRRLRGSALFMVLGLVAFWVSAMMVTEFHQLSRSLMLLSYRLSQYDVIMMSLRHTSSSKVEVGAGMTKRNLIAILLATATMLRKYLVPMYLCTASVSLLVTDDLTAQKILLNGAAVTIVANVDDLFFSFFVLDPDVQLRLDVAIQEAEESGICPRTGLWSNLMLRVHAMAWWAVLLLTTFCLRMVVRLPQHLWGSSKTPCGVVAGAMVLPPLAMGVGLVFVDTIVKTRISPDGCTFKSLLFCFGMALLLIGSTLLIDQFFVKQK